ncbi:hypothetical protein [uncultured Eubacterium sp.]|uniref:hypothetical protein n=1 Tax=uncultured Eubacterium sp. TaxID=165185 RepID=UPI0025D04BEE|nr:hypothetical protein [uncultured Eubacterium sp.]
MLIRCGKCGKMYDYEKYNGICPKCARYNRADSREDMEQSMHDRYDTGEHPRQHDWYREPENTYKQSQKFDTYGKPKKDNAWKQTGRSGDGNVRKRSGVKILIIVICLIVGISAAATVLVSRIQNVFEDGWNIDGQDYDQAEEVIDPEYQNRIYVDYAWADYLGDDLGDVDWDDYVNDYFTEATDGELEQLSALTAEPGSVYYLMSINIRNNLSDTYDLSYLTADMISLWSDEDGDGNPDTYYPVEKLFTISHPETESMDNNYIDVLVAVPKDLEDLYGACVLNDNTEEFDCYLYQDE